jgi:acyl-coenzyme A synthetase/AMP-(fatty) acid ligase
MAKFNVDTKIWESAKSPYAHPMNKYFGEEMIEWCDQTPDRVILHHHDEKKTLTCKELKDSAISIAQNLIQLGIKEDDVIGLIVKNSTFLTCFLSGSILMGAIVHPLDRSLTIDNISLLFTQTRPKMIICDSENLKKILEALEKMNLDEPLIYVTMSQHNNEEKEIFSKYPCVSELLASSSSFEKFVPPKFKKNAEDKLLAIMCSSGTTGLQKGVCITHAVCLKTNFKNMKAPPSRSLTFSTPYWSSSFYFHIYAPFLVNDVRYWTNDDFDVEKFIEIVEQHNITSVSLAPSALSVVLQSDDFLKCNHESLKSFMIVGSFFSQSLREKFRKLFPNKHLMTAYGMTEVFVSMTKPNEVYNGITVGSSILPNLQIKIVNENGEKVGPGSHGEVRVKQKLKFHVIRFLVFFLKS